MIFDISMLECPVKCRSRNTQTPFSFATADEAIAAAKSNQNDLELYFYLDCEHLGVTWTGTDWIVRCLYGKECRVDPCRECLEIPCMC